MKNEKINYFSGERPKWILIFVIFLNLILFSELVMTIDSKLIIPPLGDSKLTIMTFGDDKNFFSGKIEYPDTDYSVALPLGVLRFAECSPDYENYTSYPQGQTDIIASINVTNNGSVPGDFRIKTTSTTANGWTLFSCNDSSIDPLNDNDCLELSESYQNIWESVEVNAVKKVWLYGNCSYAASNPGTSIEIGAL